MARTAAFFFAVVFLVVAHILAAQCAATTASGTVGALRLGELLFELRVRDLGGRFNVFSGNGVRGVCGDIEFFAGHSAGDFEELEEIVELAVDVTSDCDWGGDGLGIGF